MQKLVTNETNFKVEDGALANAWANGCHRQECDHGYIDAPPAPATCDLWLGRVAQYRLGLLVFCDCPAGQAMQRLIQKRAANIVMGQRNDCTEKAGAWGAGEWNAFTFKKLKTHEEYIPHILGREIADGVKIPEPNF